MAIAAGASTSAEDVIKYFRECLEEHVRILSLNQRY